MALNLWVLLFQAIVYDFFSMILFYYHQSSRKDFTLKKKKGVWAKVNKEQDNSELPEPVQQTA